MFRVGPALTTPENAYECARLCQRATGSGGIEVSLPLETDAGIYDPWFTIEPVPNVSLRTLSWRRGSHAVVATSGIRTTSESLGFLGGSQRPVSVRSLVGKVNSAVMIYAERIFDEIVTATVPPPSTLTVTGHSAGGCVAHAFLAMMNARYGVQGAKGITFGAPRFADAAFLNQIPYAIEGRVMRATDPYPFIVPYVSESPAFAALSSAAGQSNIQTLTHGINGIVLNSDGTTAESSLPTAVPAGAFVGLLYAWAANVAGIASAHAITRYVDDLHFRTLASNPMPLRGPSVDTTPIVRGPALSHAQIVNAVESHQRDLSVPWQQREPARTGVVRVRRIARRWVVTVFDEVVYTASGKSDAKGAARSLRAVFQQYWDRPYAWLPPANLAESLWSHPELARPPIVAQASAG